MIFLSILYLLQYVQFVQSVPFLQLDSICFGPTNTRFYMNIPSVTSSDTSHTSPPPLTVHKAVIPAAGLGTRLRPLTYAFPKELLPVGREPVLSHIVTELREAGITEALFIVSESKPQIRQFFGDIYTGNRGDLPPLHCSYTMQVEQHGLGDALLYSESWVGADPFVVAFGDCIMEGREGEPSPLQRLVATHVGQQAEATVLVELVDRAKVSRYGIVAPRPDDLLWGAKADSVSHPGSSGSLLIEESPVDPFPMADIVEKPSVESAPSRLAVAARWIVTPALFPYLRAASLDARGERNMTDGVRALLAHGAATGDGARTGGWAVPLRPGEARRDIGNFESFFAQFVRSALRDPEFGESIRLLVERELNATGHSL